MQDIDFTKLISQINYTKKEKEIRKSPEYCELLSQLQPGGKVLKYQSDELDINLTSNPGDKRIRQIKVPICIEDCNHQIFDLYDIFLNQAGVQCKQCNKKGTKKNIKRDDFYTQLIKNMSEKSFSCSIVGQLCFHSFSKDIQPTARELLRKNQYQQLFQAVILNSKNKAGLLKESLLNLIAQKQREMSSAYIIHTNRILEFPFQCLLNNQKIIIPVQLSECKHMDCYEFTNILKLIDDEKKLPEICQKSFVKCYYQECQTQIPLDINQLKLKLLFPYDLARAISKNYPFSLNLIWDFQKSGFEYQKIKIVDFLKNNDLKQSFQSEPGLDYIILILFKKIINKEMNSQLQNKLRFSKYKVNLGKIQFPCRCNYCELQNVRDIEDFILSYFHQEKLKYFICPACNYQHFNINSLEQLIYFDSYLYNAQQKAKDVQQFEYNKQDNAFQKFFQFHQNIDFKQVKTLYQKTQIHPYSKQFCTLSNKQLKTPLTLIYCKEKRAVELNSLKKFLERNNFSFLNFPKCECQFCNAKGQLQITDFYYDPVFHTILQNSSDPSLFEEIKNSVTNNYLENKVVDEIPNIPKIIQKYNEKKQSQEIEQQKQKQQQQQKQQYQQQQFQQTIEQLQQEILQLRQQQQQQQQQQYQQEQEYQQQQQQYQQQQYQYQQQQYQQQQQQQQQYTQSFPFNPQNFTSNTQYQAPQPDIQQTQQFVYENGQLIPLQLYQQRQQ